ncbi:hypothetical protein PIB30_087597 [Stylosanthes scabra]|uniref:Putative plant transposon protein domain-containing protein n=1 Tax=Stylosanthes scabra TaxID=79078 RepID=A0ABU6VTR7_9FABA|nr:hypothetical protein [Stylosanthes scabra]
MDADDVLDAHCFQTLFNQRLYHETVYKKKIILEVGFNLNDEEYLEIRQQISKRGWRRLASPRSEIAKSMIREFYANVARTEEQVEGLDAHPYTSYVRGKRIDFSPENIRREMRFKEETPEAQHNYHHRRPTRDELDEVLRDLCVEGATWNMGKGKDPKPIQLRRPELTNLARGWQEFIIHNLLPTGNKSKVTVARAILIHSIMRGDEIRAEEIIADNIILITQGLGGKGKLGFPSTIYKICKAAKVRINREYGGYEECDEGRFITSEVMETVRIPQIVLGQHVEHNDEEDEPMPQFVSTYMPQNAVENEDFSDQEQDQDQPFEHHYEQPPHIEQPPLQYQQQQPQYVTYADFQQFQQSQIEQMQQYQQSQVQLMQQYQQAQTEQMQQYQQGCMQAQQQGFLKLNEQVVNMQIGIQTELGNYKEEVQTLKQKQQELFANTNNMCNRILT